MDRRQRSILDRVRRRSTPLQNHLIDEYQSGKLDRRSFLRRGAITGMSLGTLGFVAACGGSSETAATSTTASGAAGTTATTAGGSGTTAATAAPATPSAEPTILRVGMSTPAGVIDPVLINDVGRIQFFSQFAENLTFSPDDGVLRPLLAESWSPNEDNTVWTFVLKQGVLFNDGSEMTAADVVATFEGIAEGNAASALGTGQLSPGGTVAIDDYTVEFNLDAPVGSFPFMVSSDNYNAGIIPASFWENYAEGSYEDSFAGTGPFIVESYVPETSAVLIPNPNYRDAAMVGTDRVEITFFADEPPMLTAFQEGTLDIIPALGITGASVLTDDPDVIIQRFTTSEHREVHMDTTKAPFDNKLVRQAMALALDRPTIVEGLLEGLGTIANDHPIAPLFQSFNPDVPQRAFDLQTANEMIDAAGARDATIELNTLVFGEVEELAQVVQAAGRDIGLNIEVQVRDVGTYYSDYWLSTPMGITNYGHRGVPNVFLGAPLLSDGAWNASGPWVNTQYDDLVGRFIAEADPNAQRVLAGEIQTLLLDETPVIYPYFLDAISASRSNVPGLETTGMGHVLLQAIVPS